jgi:hypothetical protein
MPIKERSPYRDRVCAMRRGCCHLEPRIGDTETTRRRNITHESKIKIFGIFPEYCKLLHRRFCVRIIIFLAPYYGPEISHATSIQGKIKKSYTLPHFYSNEYVFKLKYVHISGRGESHRNIPVAERQAIAKLRQNIGKHFVNI